MKPIAILLLCLLSLTANVYSQDGESAEIWGDFNYERDITSKFAVLGEGGVRFDVSNGYPWKLYFNPGASYRIDEYFTLRGNIGLYQNWNKYATNSTEYRLSQEVDAHWPQYAKFTFNNRFKMEERFISYTNPNEDNASLPNSTSLRFRYRLIGQTDYFNLSTGIVNFFALGFIEIFIPISTSGTQNNPRQARIGAGFGQLLPKGQRYEVNLFWQGTYDEKVTESTNEKWILRLRFYLKSQPSNKD